MIKSSVYVTGASGFIGGKLIQKLEKQNVPYFAVSRKKLEVENFILVNNYNEFNPKDGSLLIHLAENNNENYAKLRGKKLVEQNKEKIHDLIKKKWEHIVYLSSALVYDFEHPNYKSGKNCNIIKATSEYQKSKIECEKIVLDAGGTVLRMTNIYGENMSKKNIFSDIFKQLQSEGPIILKNLKASRDFLWIDDAIEAIMLASKKKRNAIRYCY